MKKLFYLQTLVLLVGSIFAWYTVYTDFARFYHLYGDLTRISNCIIPNPVTTPCFYGAFSFLGGLIWSIYILKQSEQNQPAQQKKLSILLTASTIFAWSNLAIEVYNFYFKTQADQVTCSGVTADNIFVTPCFIGSAIFLVALITALIIRKKHEQLVRNSVQ